MFPNTNTQVQAMDPTISTIPMDTKNITESNYSKMLHACATKVALLQYFKINIISTQVYLLEVFRNLDLDL